MRKDPTTTPLKALLGVATGTAILLAPAALVAADKFPSKNIQVVIHSTYGGGTDTTARMMMIRSRRTLKTDMQVVSKRGGSGAKAHAYAKSRAKDGYTLLALTQTHLYTIARGKSVLSIDDVVGVARAMDDPTFITVSGKGKYKTLADLISASKTKPLNWGVAQIGGTEHIGLATFAKAAGIKFKVIPFGSGAQMIQALLSGASVATLPNVSEAGEQVRDGSFSALAVMSKKRLKDFPNVLRFVETWDLDYELHRIGDNRCSRRERRRSLARPACRRSFGAPGMRPKSPRTDKCHRTCRKITTERRTARSRLDNATNRLLYTC